MTTPLSNEHTSISSPNSSPPPSFDDIDRWRAHIGLREFGDGLQAAAKAVFPNEQQS